MRLAISIGLLWVTACNSDFSESDAPGENSDPKDPGDTIAIDFGLTENPSCEQVRDQESGESHDLAGATSYFVGNFAIDGDEVSGFEAWVLFANDTWSAGEGYDCQFVWASQGSKVAPQCLGCAYGLEMHMTMDMVGSNCVAGLKNATASDSAEFDITYDVEVKDGKSTFYFENGNVLGTGTATESTITYVSEPACKWF